MYMTSDTHSDSDVFSLTEVVILLLRTFQSLKCTAILKCCRESECWVRDRRMGRWSRACPQPLLRALLPLSLHLRSSPVRSRSPPGPTAVSLDRRRPPRRSRCFGFTWKPFCFSCLRNASLMLRRRRSRSGPSARSRVRGQSCRC
jgi:hypothetical protein